MLREMRVGQLPSRDDWNNMVKTVNMLMNMRGVDGIKVETTPNGVSIGADTRGLFRPRNAFPIDDASSGSSIDCFIDTDSAGGVMPGPRVTVNCEVAGGSDLNDAFTRLLDGTRMTIWNDNGTWRPFYPFQATSDC